MSAHVTMVLSVENLYECKIQLVLTCVLDWLLGGGSITDTNHTKQ